MLKKYIIDNRVNRGIVNEVTRLDIDVRLIERATSPLAKCVNILEVVPLGVNEMIIKPTASSGSKLKAIANNMAINGNAII